MPFQEFPEGAPLTIRSPLGQLEITRQHGFCSLDEGESDSLGRPRRKFEQPAHKVPLPPKERRTPFVYPI
jgi:hypothetical protein